MASKRFEVNTRIYESLQDFYGSAKESANGTRHVNRINYDLRDMTTAQAIRWLKASIDMSHAVKQRWLKTKRSVDDVIMNFDWYIARCNSDLLRYREKMHGETQIIPRDQLNLPEWEDNSKETQSGDEGVEHPTQED